MVRIEVEAANGREAKKLKDLLVGIHGCTTTDLSTPLDSKDPIRMRFSCREDVVDSVLNSVREPNRLLTKIKPDEISAQGPKWELSKRRKII